MADDNYTSDSEVVEEATVTEVPEPINGMGDSDEETVSDEELEELEGPGLISRFLVFYWAKRKITLPVTAALAILLVFILPISRYTVLGVMIKKDVSVTVIDNRTNVPISGVELLIRGKSAKTDGDGKAIVKGVKVGKTQLLATKKYYKDTSSMTVVGFSNKPQQLKLEATGRQLPVHVINKITGQNVAGAVIKAADTEAQTDQNGEAIIVLPANQPKVSATITAKNYTTYTAEISSTNSSVAANTFDLTPSGKVYFLSKKSGKIDVVKTDLDGSNRQTVLAGTGNEQDGGTVLLASRDWKYLALQSRRDGPTASLYLIDTSNDSLAEMDSGNAGFNLAGWSDHIFVYQANRNNVSPWQAKGQALKSYNAETKQLATLDETNAEGTNQNDYTAESIGGVYIQKDKIVYAKRWSASYYSVYRLAGKRMGLYTIKASGGGKQTVKDFDVGNNGYISVALRRPSELSVGVYNATTTFYEYKDGKFKETKDVNDDSFSRSYPTYLLSPSANYTFWSEARDGKNTLLTGTGEGGSPKELATLSEYRPFGWYGDDYILMSKNNSELFIQPSAGLGAKGQIIKISDYHKPDFSLYGYGGGYGGL